MLIICKYNQIHTTIPTKGKALPDINWLRSEDRIFFNSGQAALRKNWHMPYSEAGQTLTSLNE